MLARKFLCRLKSDAAVGAGDDDHFSGQIGHVGDCPDLACLFLSFAAEIFVETDAGQQYQRRLD